MLFAITRSSYICAQCRYRVLQNVAPRLLRLSLITHPRRNNSTFLARGPPDPKLEHENISDDRMDSLVDSFIESAFSNTSLPPRPPPGIGKADNQHRILQALPDTWEEAGVRPVVAKALLSAYPNTIRPTDIQKRILQGLKGGYSVAVRDLPGTGKSFAIAAWVLGLERAMREEPSRGSTPRLSPTTTAFIFVPNVDLGIQYYLMIKTLLQASSSQAISSSLDSFVQLLHRRASTTEIQSQIDLLSEKPNPHIIILTPPAAIDIISHKSDSINGLLDFSQATTFVLDEFDTLIPRAHPTSNRQPTLSPIFTSPPTPPSSAQVLLDWISKRREIQVIPIQPQLVLSSTTLSTSRMIKFIHSHHPLWIGLGEKSSPAMGSNIYDRPKASKLLSIGDESSGIDKIVRAVADNIVHHAVAYDISSGVMRDAPIPRTGLWATEEITQKLVELKVYEAESAEFSYRAKAPKKERDSLALTPPESWDMSNPRAKAAGYPPEIAAEALRNLLEYDKWPRNSIAAIGREASVGAFIEECRRLGIDARELTVSGWNSDMEKEGRIPIGRTDMLFDPKIREYYKERNERDACRDRAIVWVATSASARGLDVPGVFHLYVLHRLQKAREYTTYCGRVARWPLPTLEKDIKDPRSLGLGLRRGVGKVVSLFLEDHVVPAAGLKGPSAGHQVITNDGSDRANWSWLEEGLMVAKIGCHFQDYYGKPGRYPCGPEVQTPKLTRPKAPPPIPSRSFNLLDAALEPGPLQEPSLSNPLGESPSDRVHNSLFGLPQEQPEQASEEAQLQPPTDLPDLPDMWSLPFPDGFSNPREELQQPTRNPGGGEDASLCPALKDSAPPSQVPDLPIFRSPQEDFATGWRSRYAQEREASGLPARANNGRSEAPERVSIFNTFAVPEFDLKYKPSREGFRPDLRGGSAWEEEAPWQKDHTAKLVPFREVGVEPLESEKEAGKAKKVSKGEKSTRKNGAVKAQKEAAKADTKTGKAKRPKKVPEEAPERVSVKASEKSSKKASEKVPKKVPKKVSEKASEKVEKVSKKAPEKVSKKASEKVPKKASEKVPKKASEKVPKKASEKVPKKASKKTSK